MKNYKKGTKILCCDEDGEYCDEHFLKPNGKWENLTNYTPHYINGDIEKECPRLEVLEVHKLNEIPNDLETVALNTLENGISYNNINENKIDEEIMQHILRVGKDMDYKTPLYPSDKVFDKFERENRSKIGWELFYLANSIVKYRDLGRPEPCPVTGVDFGFGIYAETKCFLTEAIINTQDKMMDSIYQ